MDLPPIDERSVDREACKGLVEAGSTRECARVLVMVRGARVREVHAAWADLVPRIDPRGSEHTEHAEFGEYAVDARRVPHEVVAQQGFVARLHQHERAAVQNDPAEL